MSSLVIIKTSLEIHMSSLKNSLAFLRCYHWGGGQRNKIANGMAETSFCGGSVCDTGRPGRVHCKNFGVGFGNRDFFPHIFEAKKPTHELELIKLVGGFFPPLTSKWPMGRRYGLHTSPLGPSGEVQKSDVP